ncbi:MAG: protein phosphatase 2C domain-containing protein [Acidobacteriota bacterium]|nr:protein phosphatase 2C domain-containing protein [Acidobacteriota bacterium]
MTLTAGGRTETGPRALNQDWLEWDLDLGLFVVADGMGGHNAGEVASHLAVQAIRDFVVESAAGSDLTWPFAYEPALSVDANRLLTAVRLANRRIHEEGTIHAALEGMGTTVVAVLASGDQAVMLGVGDSRIYRWRGGALEQLTSDDTWLSTVMGIADDDRSGSSHPLKHVLTRVVGTREDLRPEVRQEPLLPGDRLVLCSDGVHGRLDRGAIASILAQGGPPDQLAEALVREALARRTGDNATALVVAAG